VPHWGAILRTVAIPDVPPPLADALRDRYVLERELGRGGMATVYLARDLKHDRAVALKVLHPEVGAALGSERFLREIRLVARLQHPHILPVHDSGESAGRLWFTMPYVEGESLRSRLVREGELPIGDAVRLLRDVADALAYAHQHGLVHRDIKPDNVLISGHHAMVADFGVAKAVSEAGEVSSRTTAGMALGTPGYMSPEQATGDPHVDARTDIYALGVLAYEMLTGQPPFAGPTVQAIFTAQLSRPPIPVGSKRQSVSSALETLVMRCLENRPADRPQSAEEVVRELEAMPSSSSGSESVPTRSKATRRNRVLVGALIAVLALLGVAFALRGRRPHSAMALDPNLVAVFPFRVSGADPSLAYLREGMVELLAVKLTGDAGPRAVDPSAALGAWRKVARSGNDLERDSALAVAGKLGAGRVIEGSIVGSPVHLTLTASLLGASKPSARVSVEGPLDSLSFLVDRLTAGVLAGESVTGEQVGQLTTTSLPALRAYLKGQAAYRRGSYREAVQHFSQALQSDSTFALAALNMNSAAGWCCGKEQQDGIRLAWAWKQSLSPRDRALLLAAAGPRYPAPSAWRERLGTWEQAVNAAPDRPEAWYGMGDVLFHLGPVVAISSSWDRSAEAFRRAVRLDTTFAGPLEHLIEYAARTGDTAGVRHWFEQARSTDSTAEIFPYLRWRTALALGDSAELQKVRAGIGEMKEQSLESMLYTVQYDGLDMEDARRSVAVMQARASTRDERELALFHSWSAAMNGGRPKEGLAALEAQREVEVLSGSSLRQKILDAVFWGGDTTAALAAVRSLSQSAAKTLSRDREERGGQLQDLCFLEHWRLSRGDTTGFGRAIAALSSSDMARDTFSTFTMAQICAPALAAWESVVQRSSNADRTLAAFDSLALTAPPGWLDFQHGNLLLAQLYEARGDPARALIVIRRRHYFLGPPLYLSTYLREEGRLAASLNDRAGAIKAYQQYLALRSNPEPSVKAEVREVKRELAKLVGEPGTQ
jgi:eukaryotic-like serine/threonine-protein kinase